VGSSRGGVKPKIRKLIFDTKHTVLRISPELVDKGITENLCMLKIEIMGYNQAKLVDKGITENLCMLKIEIMGNNQAILVSRGGVKPKIRKLIFDTKHTVLRRKSKVWLARNQIMCQSRATCLPADCCFSELAL
jgi:hypothetical protein